MAAQHVVLRQVEYRTVQTADGTRTIVRHGYYTWHTREQPQRVPCRGSREAHQLRQVLVSLQCYCCSERLPGAGGLGLEGLKGGTPVVGCKVQVPCLAMSHVDEGSASDSVGHDMQPGRPLRLKSCMKVREMHERHEIQAARWVGLGRRVADRRYSDSQSMAFHHSQIANSEGDADRLVVGVESVEADQLPRANCLSSC